MIFGQKLSYKCFPGKYHTYCTSGIDTKRIEQLNIHGKGLGSIVLSILAMLMKQQYFDSLSPKNSLQLLVINIIRNNTTVIIE